MRGGSGSGLDDRAVERLLTGAGRGDTDLERVVGLVRSLSTAPAPQPTAALAQLLDTGFEPDVAPLRRPTPRRTWAARAGAAFTAVAASLVLAGTAQALPSVLQDGLADLVSTVTPFQLPRSEVPRPAGTPAPAGEPAPPGEPTADPTTPAPAPASEPAPAPASTPPSTPALRTPTSPPPSAPAAGPTADEREDAAEEDRTSAERQERDRQRAAEKSADAAEDAADRSEDAARDAARASARASREAARASEEAAEEAAEQAERDAKDAEED